MEKCRKTPHQGNTMFEHYDTCHCSQLRTSGHLDVPRLVVSFLLHAENMIVTNVSFNMNEVIPLCIYIFTLLLYITVNTTTIQYNANATCFDLQQSSSG